MRFLKYFNLFLENFTDKLSVVNWSISYNHSEKHNIDDRILKRTEIKNENEFYEILDKIIDKCDIDKLQGDYSFISFKYSTKIVCVIKNKSIYIITILGKNENLKNDKIII